MQSAAADLELLTIAPFSSTDIRIYWSGLKDVLVLVVLINVLIFNHCRN